MKTTARLAWFYPLLGVLGWLCANPAAGAEAPLARAQGLLGALSAEAPTPTYAATARNFGALVDQVRQQDAPDGDLLRLRKLAAEMRQRTLARLEAAERAGGGDEAALEGLYRSSEWEDLSFSLTAFPFWGAWLDLSLAGRPTQAGDRVQLLWRAKRGFRAASMQIYQPSLVYGGWLGLGFLAVAEHNLVQARKIFESLIKALSFDDKHPVRKAAEAELAMLAGKGLPGSSGGASGAAAGPRDPALEPIFVLLEQHRQTKVGAREAGAKLRAVIAAGGMNMALLVDVLKYQSEIVSENLGAFGALVAAEFAFSNQQWFPAARKYKEFFAAEPRGSDLHFERFKYRYAVASLKSDLNEEAARLADQLLQTPKLEPDVMKAATKLAYVARARRMASKSTLASREELARAARHFLEVSPNDPDANGARINLAQSLGDTTAALRLLNGIKSPANARGSIETARFFVIARQFAKVANKPGGGAEALAREGLGVWATLSDEQQENRDNQAFYLQLRAVADPDPAAVLTAIALAEQQPGVSVTAQRGFFWARLRLYDRLGQPRRALAEIAGRQTPVPGWMAEQLYPWVKHLPDHALQAEFAASLAPKLKGLPEMERRFRLLNIELLLESGRGEEAYTAARALLADYPKAGDGYRMLAKAAQQTKRLIEADNAWGVITSKVPPSFEVWWEGMLSRIEIRAQSTRPAAACELVSKVVPQHPPTPAWGKRWATLRQQVSCPAA
ncbi:MAG: hypothetical protein EXR83_03060 [Gammaproteobacteria bacterium]|nr:hypothetical protein [Gammaproteobacteria bacterium]